MNTYQQISTVHKGMSTWTEYVNVIVYENGHVLVVDNNSLNKYQIPNRKITLPTLKLQPTEFTNMIRAYQRVAQESKMVVVDTPKVQANVQPNVSQPAYSDSALAYARHKNSFRR